MAPKWRAFEELVAEIQRQLAPGATVRHNDRIRGRLTDTSRQVDVSIRASVGGHDLLLIIDCKDLKGPADVKDVEEVIGLAQDVGANKTALVSANGYTAAAKKRADQAGVELLRLVDTSQHDWRTFVALPVVLVFTRLTSVRFTFRSVDPGPFQIPNIDPRHIPIVTKEGAAKGTVGDLLAHAWNESRLPHEPGEHGGLVFAESTYLPGTGRPMAVKLLAHIQVARELYYGNQPLDDVSGFMNERTGALTTRGFTTAPLDIVTILRDWQRIEAIEDLASRPALTFEGSNYLPLLSEQDLETEP